MEAKAEQYVHVLIFECPQCGGGILAAVTDMEKNLEDVDGRFLALRCSCSWVGNLLGAAARTHWIDSCQARNGNRAKTAAA